MAGPIDDEQEAARKEWLQYHLQVGEWDKAAELVVTREEREDLEYLMGRAQRMPPSSQRPGAAAGSSGAASGRGYADEEDDNLL